MGISPVGVESVAYLGKLSAWLPPGLLLTNGHVRFGVEAAYRTDLEGQL
jgi:hypothetical protein